ncbi:UNVERIFIED_CONTAM: hypothetical protein O8I53_11230 [Campylobacter lari]
MKRKLKKLSLLTLSPAAILAFPFIVISCNKTINENTKNEQGTNDETRVDSKTSNSDVETNKPKQEDGSDSKTDEQIATQDKKEEKIKEYTTLKTNLENYATKIVNFFRNLRTFSDKSKALDQYFKSEVAEIQNKPESTIEEINTKMSDLNTLKEEFNNKVTQHYNFKSETPEGVLVGIFQNASDEEYESVLRATKSSLNSARQDLKFNNGIAYNENEELKLQRDQLVSQIENVLQNHSFDLEANASVEQKSITLEKINQLVDLTNDIFINYKKVTETAKKAIELRNQYANALKNLKNIIELSDNALINFALFDEIPSAFEFKMKLIDAKNLIEQSKTTTKPEIQVLTEANNLLTNKHSEFIKEAQKIVDSIQTNAESPKAKLFSAIENLILNKQVILDKLSTMKSSEAKTNIQNLIPRVDTLFEQAKQVLNNADSTDEIYNQEVTKVNDGLTVITHDYSEILKTVKSDKQIAYEAEKVKAEQFLNSLLDDENYKKLYNDALKSFNISTRDDDNLNDRQYESATFGLIKNFNNIDSADANLGTFPKRKKIIDEFIAKVRDTEKYLVNLNNDLNKTEVLPSTVSNDKLTIVNNELSNLITSDKTFKSFTITINSIEDKNDTNGTFKINLTVNFVIDLIIRKTIFGSQKQNYPVSINLELTESGYKTA